MGAALGAANCASSVCALCEARRKETIVCKKYASQLRVCVSVSECYVQCMHVCVRLCTCVCVIYVAAERFVVN